MTDESIREYTWFFIILVLWGIIALYYKLKWLRRDREIKEELKKIKASMDWAETLMKRQKLEIESDQC